MGMALAWGPPIVPGLDPMPTAVTLLTPEPPHGAWEARGRGLGRATGEGVRGPRGQREEAV